MRIESRRSAVFGAGALVGAAMIFAACSSSAAAGGATAASQPAVVTGGAYGGGAYGGGAYGGGAYGGGNNSKAAPTTAPAAAAAAGSVVGIKSASGTVGAYLTGQGGMTLYVFKKDSPNVSACSGACATNWPPLTLGPGGSPTAGAGVTGSLTTFARADGTMQVAYNGAPVYYFAADTKAGDTNGQGVGGVWFVAQP